MKKITKYSPQEEIIQLEKDCRNWLSQVSSWRYSIRFMEKMLPRAIVANVSKSHRTKLHTLHQELHSNIGARIDELYKKLRMHQVDIRQQRRAKKIRKLSGNRILHHFFRKEFLKIKEQYRNMRQSFFDLVKPSLKQLNMQNAA
jgi:DNA helicase TIP49 (TBP-interacting protein)